MIGSYLSKMTSIIRKLGVFELYDELHVLIRAFPAINAAIFSGIKMCKGEFDDCLWKQ